MIALAVVLIAVLVVCWAIVEGAALLGFLAMLIGEDLERCSRCHHFGLTTGHAMHPNGCPVHFRSRIVHEWAALAHRLHTTPFHLGHH
jgi:hypothetical protein